MDFADTFSPPSPPSLLRAIQREEARRAGVDFSRDAAAHAAAVKTGDVGAGSCTAEAVQRSHEALTAAIKAYAMPRARGRR